MNNDETMVYTDETLVCKECGQEFTFTARDQEFYAKQGYENKPQRCKVCRDKRKAERGELKPERQMFDAICADCGKECQVPFQPREDKPVYCRECFEKNRK